MFAQVMEGKVADEEGLRRQLATWMADLRPGATGWVGTTAGFPADGTFFAVTRFESEEAARANSDRPEQGAWWEATASGFDGDVTFTDCPEVDMFGAGGSDDAGFVQVITGQADREAILPVADDITAMLRQVRPDVIGGTVAWPGDGRFIQVVYFTSEGEARAAEGADPASDEDRAARERLMSLMQFERFIDLRDPMLYSR
jgi:hypothetical protein